MKPDIISAELEFAQEIKSAGFVADGTNSILYKWVDTHWAAINDNELERMAWDFLAAKRPESANPRLAQSSARAAILNAPKIPQRRIADVVIPCRNGYVCIGQNGVARLDPHDKFFGITFCLQADFNSASNARKFEEFITSSMPDSQTLGFLQEFTGYTLLGDTRHELGAWLIGGGGNGKSTFANVVSSLHSNPVSMSLDALDGFKLNGIIGASLVYCDETPRKIDEERLKTLISGGLVRVDRKYRDDLSFRPTAKWIVSGNALPALSDHSDGFWRRWVIFPFTVKPATVQPLLAETIIDEELSGVLNWALAGLKKLLERGRFPTLSPLMLEARDQGKKETNSVLGWWLDMEPQEVDNVDAGTDKDIVYRSYQAWAKRNGSSPVAAPKFWARIKQQVNLLERKVTIGGRRIRMVGLSHPDFRDDFF